MRTEETLSALDELIRERSILQHAFLPCLATWRIDPPLSLPPIPRVYYPHVRGFPELSGERDSCAEDFSPDARWRTIYSTTDQSRAAPELWLDFATAIGQDRDKVTTSTPLAKVASTTSISIV